MMSQKVLFIGLVWPEPTSSAAGTRILQLVQLFLDAGHDVHFASAASSGQYSFDLTSIGAITHAIELNSNSFNHFIKNLHPDIVVFDRFMIEEQYGWRVEQECPNATRILDTEDLHFLRQARQTAHKNTTELNFTGLYNEVTKREIASIFRCDLSLIISKFELELLQQQFKIDPDILYYLPFLEEEIDTIHHWQSFEQRQDFVFIGNYLHEPNWQTLKYLKTKVWPLLRKKVPASTLHIYGAYASQKVMQLHNVRERFLVHGRAENARNTISKHRILLAPLLFGAGVKGKFIDAMQTGTPIVTSTIGAEGMQANLSWPGLIVDDLEELVNQTAKLYQDESGWTAAQRLGIEVINQLYSKAKFEKAFTAQLQEIKAKLVQHRQRNFFGEILHHHSLQSTKYLSLWIEEKNKSNSFSR